MLCTIDWPTVITAFIGVVTIYALFRIGKNAEKYTESSSLKAELSNLINILMQFPFLEDNVFISEFKAVEHRNDEMGTRYSAYCMLYVNYFGRVFDYFKGDKKKMLRFVNFKDWIYIHRAWWNNAQFASPESFNIKLRKILNDTVAEKAKEIIHLGKK